MSEANVDAIGVDQEWRESARLDRQSRVQVFLRRTLIIALIIVAVIALVVFLLRLFTHSRTHLFVIHASGMAPLTGPTRPVAGHELDLLASLKGVDDHKSSEKLDRLIDKPDQMATLREQLNDETIRKNDALILYVAAHGVVFDNKAYLVCNNFEPLNPTYGIYDVAKILDALSSCPAKVKLLILDGGQMDYDPRIGIVANNFATEVRNAVKAKKDSKLFVLCSHDDLQRSNYSTVLDGSIFGILVAAGLQGAADNDGNGYVSVDELQQFVVSTVSSWVDTASGGSVQQVPRFFGGDSQIAAENVLRAETHQLDIRALIASAQGKRASAGALPKPSGPVRGYLARLSSEEVQDSTAPSPGKEEGAGAAKSDKSDTPEKQASDSNKTADGKPDGQEQVSKLLSSAWRICDQLSTANSDQKIAGELPWESTPHLWREIQEELVAYEQAIQSRGTTGPILPTESLQRAIGRITSQSSATSRHETDAHAHENPDNSPGVRSIPGLASAIKSLAFAELVAGRSDAASEKQIKELKALLDGLIEAPPDELHERISKIPPAPEMNRYYELRLINQLGDVATSRPALAQLALQVRRNGERAAASSWWSADWLAEPMEIADQHRLAGERQLLDQVGKDWPASSRHELESADRLYALVASRNSAIGEATHLRNKLTFRVPYYLRLMREFVGDDTHYPVACGQLQEMLADLNELATLLDKPIPSKFDQLTHLQSRIQAIISGPLAADIGDSTGVGKLGYGQADNGWRVSRVLETPLPSGRERRSMNLAAEYNDSTTASSMVLENSRESDSRPNLGRRIALCRLEAAAARLATPEDTIASLELDGPSSASKEANASSNGLENALHAFGGQIANFYHKLPERLHSLRHPRVATSYAEAQNDVVDARRALQLLDARDAYEFSDLSITDFSRNLELYDLLSWQEKRCMEASADAPRDEVAYLTEAANAYRSAASELFNFSDSSAKNIASVEIQAADQVGLVEHLTENVPISVAYRGDKKVDVWLVVEFDPDLLDVELPANVYSEHHGPDSFPYRPDRDAAARPATWTGIVRGDAPGITLPVRLHAGANRVAKLVVKAITRATRVSAAKTTASAADELANDVNVEVRHTIDVPVRLIDSVVDAASNTWQTKDDSTVLQPFPNGLTNYRFGVVNHGKTDRNVAMRFFAAPAKLRIESLNDTDTRREIGRLAPLGQMLIPSPADGEPHYATIAGAEPAPAEGHKPEAGPAADESAKNAKAESLPTGPQLNHGLIVEVSDPKDPTQISYRQFDIVAQRPRRYVRPQVAYNSRLERIEVTVRPRSASSQPDKPVRVACKISGGLDNAAEGKLEDVISAPDYEAKLFVYVPAQPPREVTLYVDVDGYPRAFIYKVPCGSGVVDLAEETGVSELRLHTAQGAEFQPPSAVTPLIAQVDAPVGAFAKGEDFVRTALDDNMDQRFGPEHGFRFDADRQANAYFDHLEPSGVLSIDMRVGDYVVPLGTKSLQNVAIQVNGESVINGRETDARPLTLKFDSAGPKVQYVEVSPGGGFVTAGTELQVAIVAFDSMSGVRQVEVGFDTDRTGKFSEKIPPAKAVPESQAAGSASEDNGLNIEGSDSSASTADGQAPQRWLAILPTKDLHGSQTLLVRATDRVGNASDIYSKRIHILTPEQAAEKSKSQPNKGITGIVTHQGHAVPGAELTLFDIPEKPPAAAPAGANAPAAPAPEGKQVATSKAGEDGSFTIAGVAPGKYKLKAQGVIHNTPRFSEREVVVDPASANATNAELPLE